MIRRIYSILPVFLYVRLVRWAKPETFLVGRTPFYEASPDILVREKPRAALQEPTP